MFKSLMDAMFGELQPRCAVVYINDITIFSPSLWQHLIDLSGVFKILTAVNLNLNLRSAILSKLK